VAIVNAAGYTAVDRAQSEPGQAFRANRDGARTLAKLFDGEGKSLGNAVGAVAVSPVASSTPSPVSGRSIFPVPPLAQ